MLSAWLSKEAAGLVLGALVKLLLGAFQNWQANKAQRDLGAARTANEANVKTIEMQDAIENVPRPTDDAVADSLRTGKF
jgi:hypothetical protein